MQSFLRRIDSFQTLPRELTDTSSYGGTYSIAAVCILIFLFFSEFSNYMTARDHTYIVMNQEDSKTLEIIFDVTMLALPCDHVDIMLYDAFRESALTVHSSTLTRTPIINGELQVEQATTVTKMNEDGTVGSNADHPELDMDWDSSSAIMKEHITFESVIKAHDFTFINFYADWCSHCRKFAPTWNEAEKASENIQFQDAEGKDLNVRMIRINCVEFSEQCSSLNIPYFPNIRLYKSDTHFDMYDQPERTKDDLLAYLKDKASSSHHKNMQEVGKEKNMIQSCKLHGSLITLRVPGEFHFQVKSNDRSLVPSMTNVSHVIHKLAFADTSEEQWNLISERLPKNIQENMNPLKDQTFITYHPHISPQHHVQVVTTKIKDQLVYQLTVQSHTKPEERTAVPQAKFSYSISPMTVVVSKKNMPFYKFLTSICALLGGAYTLIKMLHSTTDYIVKKKKAGFGKLG